MNIRDCNVICADPDCFDRGGPTTFFRETRIQIPLKADHYRSARERPFINEPRHEISNYVVCATSKDSDQPAHTRILIRAVASRFHIL